MRKKMLLCAAICCLAGMSVCGGGIVKGGIESRWKLVLNSPGKVHVVVTLLPADLSRAFQLEKDIDGIHLLFQLLPQKTATAFKVTASAMAGRSVFFSLEKNYTDEVPWNFNGQVVSPEVYRQSPHDVNAWITDKIAKQAIPVVALRSDGGFEVALNGSPALYSNFTSQAFYTDRKTISLASGDDGATPGLRPDTGLMKKDYNTEKDQVLSPGKIVAFYHRIGPGKKHVFEGLLFTSHASDLTELREDINRQAADYFSGGRVKEYFGALAFTTSYMNLRVNETGKSAYWVVPSVEYANTQYCRDAFWIATMLDDSMSNECLRNELVKVNTYAEYPLMTILWAYRSFSSNRPVDRALVQAYVDSVENRAKDGYFYSYTDHDGRQDFQYWGDLIAFDKDDVVTYNQGLFALALKCSRKMGLSTSTDPEKAIANYRGLFNDRDGFYPLSKKKDSIFGPDVLVADLLSQIYFKQPLLPSGQVKRHYDAVISRLKTKYGFKMVGQRNGSYLKNEQYDAGAYASQANKEGLTDGQYIRGGSYLLYDALFLMDGYLHGIASAENELEQRLSLDFGMGGTTYECLNTVTGEPWKPNMGWNIAIYYYWQTLIGRGKAGDGLLRHIDSLANQHPLPSIILLQ